MLQLPGGLTAESFLARYWQKQALFMSAALVRVRPAVTRNELGWLATLDDVESRIVFTMRGSDRLRYRAETGPFEEDYLASLPQRDWTLLVHDVEKHLPALRRLFDLVPFIPDWRIDDLMVSFAAPGGGVGPHRDHYDVFLCQGIGVRQWHVTDEDVPPDSEASDDLALTKSFSGTKYAAGAGDVLYLPPGVAHWGTARRACITYSIGMRAPQFSDLVDEFPDEEACNPFYSDPDLTIDEALPGYIAPAAARRAAGLINAPGSQQELVATSLGKCATEPKDWITPDLPDTDAVDAALRRLADGGKLDVHGMARLAWDDTHVYANGRHTRTSSALRDFIAGICRTRELGGPLPADPDVLILADWMLRSGAFDIPGNN
jgi:50S ribosomal protein L16 3-hydroxylase